MNISKEPREGVDVLTVVGKLDSNNATEFDSRLREDIDEASGRMVILNFAGVLTLTSAPLRAILSLAKRMQRHGAILVVAAPGENALESLRISGFLKLKIFELTETVEMAFTLVREAGPRPVRERSAVPAVTSLPNLPSLPVSTLPVLPKEASNPPVAVPQSLPNPTRAPEPARQPAPPTAPARAPEPLPASPPLPVPVRDVVPPPPAAPLPEPRGSSPPVPLAHVPAVTPALKAVDPPAPSLPPAVRPEPIVAPQPEPLPIPKPEAPAEPKLELKPEPKIEPKIELKVESKPEPKRERKPDPVAESVVAPPPVPSAPEVRPVVAPQVPAAREGGLLGWFNYWAGEVQGALDYWVGLFRRK